MAETIPNQGAVLSQFGESTDAIEFIRVRGARTHNLRNIDLDIPRDRLVVVTGPSGSGKSSLAFDTLYAEGQRQYIESLSVYARRFINQMERPDVDLIDGLGPTVSIDQRAGGHNPRSTVATVTEIYDYLRVLMARFGEAFCYQCREPIRQQSPNEIVDELLALPEGTKAMILAPLVRGRKGQHREVFDAVRKMGLVRVRVDGQLYEIDAQPELAPQRAHNIEVVVDRVVVREGNRSRFGDAVAAAVKHSSGTVAISYLVDVAARDSPDAWRDKLFSTQYSCPRCKISYEEVEPRTFSFNSPYGACAACEGLGVRVEFDPDLVLAHPQLSLATGAIAPWKGQSGPAARRREQPLADFLKSTGLQWDTPLTQLKPQEIEELLRGNRRGFSGVLALLEGEYSTALDPDERVRLESYRGAVACQECHGARLRAEARSVRWGGKAIHEITAMTVESARPFFAVIDAVRAAEPLVRQIANRLEFLERVGLAYLSLDRAADTLSGGELQRVRLASGIGSALVGVCYILDEPSMGLHPRDNDRLIQSLRTLQEQGNTVLVVEHDRSIMEHADHLIDLGPGAGRLGGQVVAQGTPEEVRREEHSLTGQYLSRSLTIPIPPARRTPDARRVLTLAGVTTNNLKNVDFKVPLSAFTCITGVSGAGKSSLVSETLARAVSRRLGLVAPKPGPHTGLRGAKQLDRVVEIDQKPIGRSPRSNPATYIGVFDEIRKVFAHTRDARLRAFRAGRFSFNIRGGRCDECQGQGIRRIEMNFLPDLYLTCPVCEGARFNRQTLQVRYRERNIAEVLEMTVDESARFFENFAPIVRALNCVRDVGLGYVTIGQSSTTLSGGEAQRLKLATELGRGGTGRTLYILDEPTTGLHFDDIRKLLAVLDRLVELGNTVIVIEHNLDVMKSADWIVDLGPEGGERGGYILAACTPEEIARLDDNATGIYLRAALDGQVSR